MNLLFVLASGQALVSLQTSKRSPGALAYHEDQESDAENDGNQQKCTWLLSSCIEEV